MNDRPTWLSSQDDNESVMEFVESCFTSVWYCMSQKKTGDLHTTGEAYYNNLTTNTD